MISKNLPILSLEFEIFSPSLEQFFLTVGQNNFVNKIPFLALALKLKIGSQQRKQRQTKKRFASLSKWTINVSRWIDLRKTAKMVQNGVRSYLKDHLFSRTCISTRFFFIFLTLVPVRNRGHCLLKMSTNFLFELPGFLEEYPQF